MNLSNFTFINSQMEAYSGMPEIKYQAIIRDYATQLDEKILMAVMIIFTAWLMYFVILPKSKEGFKDTFLYNFNPRIFNLFYSKMSEMFENLAFLSAMFIYSWFFFQGKITGKYLIWSIIIGVFVLLSLLSNFFHYIRNKEYKKDIKDINSKIQKLEISKDE